MTADIGTRSTARPETGWAQARRRRRTGPRTCLPATAGASARQDRTAPDWNIVRGED
ncbi:hypothetical protein ACFVU0_08575 [Streptomyces sp. NPDC058122]|uniref:hypothetical protein n=1 Tax=Streptomyces sp. NPDC058122 TaxID=3346349 RepID=UPI0036E38331